MINSQCSINIIGCGKLGRTLGKLWYATGEFSIQDVVASHQTSALEAVAFIGAGRAQVSLAAICPADIFLVATPDTAIAEVVAELLSHGKIGKGSTVFHCSGALSSEVLAHARGVGASIASVHPVKSFSSPSEATQSFAGTYCAIEGDEAAIVQLTSAFQRIGANIFSVNADSKVLYHAAFVFACNYLTALMECAFQCCEASGIERAAAAKMIEPLVKETTAAVISRGVDSALTGPVVRGDTQVIVDQLSKLGKWRDDYADLYARLGRVALEIASRSGTLTGAALEKMREALSAR